MVVLQNRYGIRVNPVGCDGEYLRCWFCGSNEHFKKSCPYRRHYLREHDWQSWNCERQRKFVDSKNNSDAKLDTDSQGSMSCDDNSNERNELTNVLQKLRKMEKKFTEMENKFAACRKENEDLFRQLQQNKLEENSTYSIGKLWGERVGFLEKVVESLLVQKQYQNCNKCCETDRRSDATVHENFQNPDLGASTEIEQLDQKDQNKGNDSEQFVYGTNAECKNYEHSESDENEEYFDSVENMENDEKPENNKTFENGDDTNSENDEKLKGDENLLNEESYEGDDENEDDETMENNDAQSKADSKINNNIKPVTTFEFEIQIEHLENCQRIKNSELKQIEEHFNEYKMKTEAKLNEYESKINMYQEAFNEQEKELYELQINNIRVQNNDSINTRDSEVREDQNPELEILRGELSNANLKIEEMQRNLNCQMDDIEQLEYELELFKSKCKTGESEEYHNIDNQDVSVNIIGKNNVKIKSSCAETDRKAWHDEQIRLAQEYLDSELEEE